MAEASPQNLFNGWPIAEKCTLEQALRWIVDRLPPLTRQAETLESYPDPISYDEQNAVGHAKLFDRYELAGKMLITKIIRNELHVIATPYVMPGAEVSFTPVSVPKHVTSHMWGYEKIDWVASCLNPVSPRMRSYVIFSIRINFNDLQLAFPAVASSEAQSRTSFASISTGPSRRGPKSHKTEELACTFVGLLTSGTLTVDQLLCEKQQVLADQYGAARSTIETARKAAVSQFFETNSDK